MATTATSVGGGLGKLVAYWCFCTKRQLKRVLELELVLELSGDQPVLELDELFDVLARCIITWLGMPEGSAVLSCLHAAWAMCLTMLVNVLDCCLR